MMLTKLLKQYIFGEKCKKYGLIMGSSLLRLTPMVASNQPLHKVGTDV